MARCLGCVPSYSDIVAFYILPSRLPRGFLTSRSRKINLIVVRAYVGIETVESNQVMIGV